MYVYNTAVLTLVAHSPIRDGDAIELVLREPTRWMTRQIGHHGQAQQPGGRLRACHLEKNPCQFLPPKMHLVPEFLSRRVPAGKIRCKTYVYRFKWRAFFDIALTSRKKSMDLWHFTKKTTIKIFVS